MKEKILNEFGQKCFDAAKARMILNGSWDPIYIPTIRTLAFTMQELELTAEEALKNASEEINNSPTYFE